MSVPGKFHRSAGHTKRNCLQDRSTYYRFRAWHILLIFNTAPCWTLDIRMSNIQLTSSSCISGNLSSSRQYHYDDVTMSLMASQITSLTIVYSTVYSGADQRKHQSSASLAFVRGIHRGQVNSPHKWPVTRKMFPFDDVIMTINSSGKHPGDISGRLAVTRCQLYSPRYISFVSTFLKRNRYIYSYRFKYRYTLYFEYGCRTMYIIYIYINIHI